MRAQKKRISVHRVTVHRIPWNAPTFEEVALVQLVLRLGTERVRAVVEQLERLAPVVEPDEPS